jgi:hypothetical protein
VVAKIECIENIQHGFKPKVQSYWWGGEQGCQDIVRGDKTINKTDHGQEYEIGSNGQNQKEKSSE